MNKDVIYIDVEDDVTAIIGKIKDSKEKVVALVPPKRTGVLQSAVNLRIMQRTAKSSGKHLVLITNDSSLIPLAAGAGLPVAKNLQSKPEVPEIAALKIDDDDDIIDGSELPIGEHAATASAAATSVNTSKPPEKSKYATPPKSGESPRKSGTKNAGKVPNFNSFRKKLIFIIVGVILLIAFLVWAIFFAPRATVEITAKTSSERIATAVNLGVDAKTDAEAGTLKMLKAEEVTKGSVEFSATGTEERGEAASGTMTLSRSSGRSVTVPAGTGFSDGDCTFVTRSVVTVPGAGVDLDNPRIVPGEADVKVKATAIGEQCNLSSRDYESTISGISAEGGSMTGGSKEIIKIVTQADVQAASEQLAKQNDTEVKAKLEDRFPRTSKVIDTSFRSSAAEVKSSPEVGQEAANGKASLNSSITYTMNAVATSELDKYIEKAVDMKISNENEQRVYESGASKATVVDFAATETGGTANLTATAQVGPQIDDTDLKKRVAGKRFGDIQSDIESIQGVDRVDVHFFPFWVNTVPEDLEKVNIEFNLENS